MSECWQSVAQELKATGKEFNKIKKKSKESLRLRTQAADEKVSAAVFWARLGMFQRRGSVCITAVTTQPDTAAKAMS